ncbi:DNA polymerase Y family protein [Roseateles sp. BYS180W]|uniref:DNA polymerase Y family protein n=1 Tax=Roseateles rivi TaxID=3299028 RepID=A0ABW7FWA1_9BURK
MLTPAAPTPVPRAEVWLAVLPTPEPQTAQPTHAREAWSWWALQYTPRVAWLEEGLLLELRSSLRLFGGLRRVHQRLQAEARLLHGARLAWAPHALAALALARCQVAQGLRGPLEPVLDALPLHALSAARPHLPMLARLGLRRLGQLRALPRAGVARRFGPDLLQALAQLYGEHPLPLRWEQAAEHFEHWLELPWRVDNALALLPHAQALLQQLCLWLGARQGGLREFELCWRHDAMRARDIGPGGQLRLATAEPSRDALHWGRLLKEQLQRLQLNAPVAELGLRSAAPEPLSSAPLALLLGTPDQREAPREALHQLLERLSLRVGPERLRRAQSCDDHRLECAVRWEPCTHLPARRTASTPPPWLPRPSWLLRPPLPLASRADQPLHHGPLQQLAGPQRMETGWWDQAPSVQRDYYLFASASGALLWLYRERPRRSSAPEASARWYLHGIFG